MCRVDVQLIFKNVRRNEKVYTKCKSEKIPEAGSALRIDLKMELPVKIVNDFNLFFQKRSICVTGSEFASDYNKSKAFYK